MRCKLDGRPAQYAYPSVNGCTRIFHIFTKGAARTARRSSECTPHNALGVTQRHLGASRGWSPNTPPGCVPEGLRSRRVGGRNTPWTSRSPTQRSPAPSGRAIEEATGSRHELGPLRCAFRSIALKNFIFITILTLGAEKLIRSPPVLNCTV